MSFQNVFFVGGCYLQVQIFNGVSEFEVVRVFFQLIFVSSQLLVRIASDGTLHCEQNAINDEREDNSI